MGRVSTQDPADSACAPVDPVTGGEGGLTAPLPKPHVLLSIVTIKMRRFHLGHGTDKPTD